MAWHSTIAKSIQYMIQNHTTYRNEFSRQRRVGFLCSKPNAFGSLSELIIAILIFIRIHANVSTHFTANKAFQISETWSGYAWLRQRSAGGRLRLRRHGILPNRSTEMRPATGHVRKTWHSPPRWSKFIRLRRQHCPKVPRIHQQTQPP